MTSIWKFRIKDIVEMPVGAEILTAAMQNGETFVWAIVDTLHIYTEERMFVSISTGGGIRPDENLQYINTIHECGDVQHIFERIS